mmetsp:Transcript_48915/g.157332  ORF Transcript_48915/g.157332 Transcript_48915/m.157332 type:complete len:741 (+) Transcript_48915:977-3199(+)
MLEEASNIGSHQRLARQGEGPDHGDRCLQVLPLGVVVAGPDRGVLVRADEEGPREHEGPVPRHALLQAFEGGPMMVVAVHVVHIPVLDVAVGVDGIPRASHLGAVENGRLVHVVPDVQVLVGALVLVECELGAPVVAHPRVREVGVPRGARPAPALEVRDRRVRVRDLFALPFSLVCRVRDLGHLPLAVLLIVPDLRLHRRGVVDLLRLLPVRRLGVRRVIHHLPVDLLDEKALITDLLIDMELVILLDVRIHHVDKHPALGGYGVHHFLRRREARRVPCEVGLAVGVLDVKPNHVIREVVLVVVGIHTQGVLLGHVVPAALMFAQGPQRRHGRTARQRVELTRDLGGRGADEHGSVQDTGLRGPPSVRGASGLALRKPRGPPCLALGVALELHEGLRGVDPQEGRGQGRLPACAAVDGPEEGHRAVQGHGLVVLVLKDVQVEEAVRLIEERQASLHHVLGQAEEPGHVALEGHVHAEGGRASGLLVRVAAKVLLPEPVGVQAVGVRGGIQEHLIRGCLHVARAVGWQRRLRFAVALKVQVVPPVETLQNAAICGHHEGHRAVLQLNLDLGPRGGLEGEHRGAGLLTHHRTRRACRWRLCHNVARRDHMPHLLRGDLIQAEADNTRGIGVQLQKQVSPGLALVLDLEAPASLGRPLLRLRKHTPKGLLALGTLDPLLEPPAEGALLAGAELRAVHGERGLKQRRHNCCQRQHRGRAPRHGCPAQAAAASRWPKTKGIEAT